MINKFYNNEIMEDIKQISLKQNLDDYEYIFDLFLFHNVKINYK